MKLFKPLEIILAIILSCIVFNANAEIRPLFVYATTTNNIKYCPINPDSLTISACSRIVLDISSSIDHIIKLAYDEKNSQLILAYEDNFGNRSSLASCPISAEGVISSDCTKLITSIPPKNLIQSIAIRTDKNLNKDFYVLETSPTNIKTIWSCQLVKDEFTKGSCSHVTGVSDINKAVSMAASGDAAKLSFENLKVRTYAISSDNDYVWTLKQDTTPIATSFPTSFALENINLYAYTSSGKIEVFPDIYKPSSKTTLNQSTTVENGLNIASVSFIEADEPKNILDLVAIANNVNEISILKWNEETNAHALVMRDLLPLDATNPINASATTMVIAK